jgi:hypothetical protein
MTAHNNDIDEFEAAVYKRNYPTAFELLLKLFQTVSMLSNTDCHFENPAEAQVNATRITSALMCMLSDKKFKVDWLKFARIIVHKRTITSLFRISGFSGSQSCLSYFSNNISNSKVKKDETCQIYKMLIIMGLADHNEQTLNFLINLDPKISTPYILSLLSSYVVMSEKEHIVREQLLAFGPILKQHPFDLGFSGTLSIAWMNCSYGIREDKHLLKGHLNIMMRQAMEKSGFKKPEVKPIDNKIKKPKVVVLAETFKSNHAMFRCYSNYIKQLKPDFEVILISSSNSVDKKSEELFDQSVIFDLDKITVPAIGNLISEQKPDIIYYPSLGMAAWTIALLTFRFAPIQILTPGHPATSISDSIDYIISTEFLVSDPSLYSERILMLNDGIGVATAPPNENLPIPKINKDPEVLQIAVNSKSFKINALFLAACQQINSTVNRPIQWVFFPNETGLQYQHCCFEITQWLPNSKILKSLPYNDYLQILNQCDIAVGTFPFGGSNTNTDLIRLGIPKVYFTGNEIHSRADAVMYNCFDTPQWLSCNSPETWCDSTLKLIHDDELRCQLSESLLEQSPSDRIMENDTALPTGFSTAVKWVWANHQNILDKDLRVVKPEEECRQSISSQG